MELIGEDGEIQASSHYSQSHWARAITKTLVKLRNLNEPIVALIDHGSEINFRSKKLYEQEKWPIDIDHN